MRKPMVFALWCTLLASASAARGQASKIDLYGGYDYVRYNANPRADNLPPSESFNANGVSGQIACNVSDWLGLVAEISGYAVARKGFNTTHQISYLFGPRLDVRRGSLVPFARVLLGGAWAEDGIVFGSVNGFAMTAGGGLDIRLSQRIAIRPVQAEYFLTTFPDGNNNRQNNFRYGAGIILLFGSR